MSERGNERPDTKQADHRRHLRSPLLVLRVKLDDGRKSFFGYAKNISRSGLFVSSVNPREPGERFQVEIPLPAPLSRTVQCTAEVVWKRLYSAASPLEPGMGLRFTDLPEEVAAALDRWIREEAEKEGKG